MRTKVKSSEVCHLWAHQTQQLASTPGGMSFEGADFYSYGTVIASILNTPKGIAYLITRDYYSVTTSGHQSCVHQSIPRDATTFVVPGVQRGYRGFSTPDRIMGAWTDNVTRMIEDAAKAREPKKSRLLSESASIVARMREFAAFVGIKKYKYPAIPASTTELAAMMAAKLKRDALAEKRRKAEQEKRDAIRRIELAEARQQWLDGSSERPNWSGYFPTELRIVEVHNDIHGYSDGNAPASYIVETSKGATFPVNHARKGLMLVKSVMNSGKEWKTNGHTCYLGHYRIDRITPDGTVYAGCHVVTYPAIKRIEADLLANVSPMAYQTALESNEAV